MENVTASKMQAVELAKSIVEARDAELAFLLQLQEIVKSTTTLPDDYELEESLSQEVLIGIDLQDSQIEADKDKDVALTVAVDNLGTLVVETEESQLSFLEANRLAHLDAIQEHDALFARSIANAPLEDWEEIGDEMADPFDVPHGPNEIFAYNEVDEQFDSVLCQLGDAASTIPRKRLHAGLGKSLLVIRRAKVPTTVNLHETEQKKKGKEVLQEGGDDDALPASPLPVRSRSKKSRKTIFLPDSLEDKDGDATDQTDDDADECGQRLCQICFDASLATSPFISLEGCGHKFCETCVSRHAEARILDGQMLEILSRRQIEAAIPDSERLYCPFKDCSALLCKPSRHVQRPSSSTHPHPTALCCVECDVCHRAFCLECEVAWHADMSCTEYKANLKNRRLLGDEKLLQLADKQKWQRCKCGRVVELTFGCHHMSCVCGHGFCYICGAPWLTKNSKTCTCPRWNESKL